MAPNWQVWDMLNDFDMYYVPYLWVEREPAARVGFQNASIQAFGREIRNYLKAHHPKIDSHYSVKRAILVEMAKAKGVKPKFLFPEERREQPTQINSKTISAQATQLAADSRGEQPTQVDPKAMRSNKIDTRQLDSYRIILLAALTKLEIYPRKSGSVARLERLIEQTEYKLDTGTIGKILDSLDLDLDEILDSLENVSEKRKSSKTLVSGRFSTKPKRE